MRLQVLLDALESGDTRIDVWPITLIDSVIGGSGYGYGSGSGSGYGDGSGYGYGSGSGSGYGDGYGDGYGYGSYPRGWSMEIDDDGK